MKYPSAPQQYGEPWLPPTAHGGWHWLHEVARVVASCTTQSSALALRATAGAAASIVEVRSLARERTGISNTMIRIPSNYGMADCIGCNQN